MKAKTKKIMPKEKSKIVRLLRRYFFYYLNRKEMMRRYKKITKGKKCGMCGCCKNKSFPCKYFDRKKNLCLVWKDKKMPLLCMITPFDFDDMTDYQLKNCTFSPYSKKQKKNKKKRH